MVKTDLYALLGVPRKATKEEIARAYRRQALKYHPDRNPDGEEMFKQLAMANEILCNDERREIYNVTGVVSDAQGPNVEEDDDSPEAKQRRYAEFSVELDKFYDTYCGSEEEKADLISAFNATKGNFCTMIRGHLIFRNETDEIKRLYKLTLELLEDGLIDATPHSTKTLTPPMLKKLERTMEEERKAANAERDVIGLSDSKKPSTQNGEGALATLILNRQMQAAKWDCFADSLMEKYATKKATKKGRSNADDDAEPMTKKARTETTKKRQKQHTE